jgi:hypothetical protein
MFVLFVGTGPRASLERALTAGGGVIHRDRWPDEGPPPDLVAIRHSGSDTARFLRELAIWHERFPRAWIAAIVSRSALRDRALTRELLRCPSLDDVWGVANWQSLFWFAARRAQREQRLRAGLAPAALPADWSTVSDASGHLVRQLERDVELASHIQRSLLPKSFPQIPGVALAAKYLPATSVGGDYYDIFEFGDRRRFGVLLADSKTHGMAAALLSVLLKLRLEEMKERFPDSRSLLMHLHQELHQIDAKDRASLSVLYGILDRNALTFQYTAAGHLQPLLWRQNRRVGELLAATAALGEGQAPVFNEQTVQLKPGDLLFFHTDGLFQILGARGAPLEELERMLSGRGAFPDPIDIQMDLLGLVHQHQEKAELPDDVTILQFAIGPRALYLSHSR